jgi:hypothetical protein
MIFFGWGRRTYHHAGPVLYQRCSNCKNANWFYLVVVRRWFTLFFIPLIPYERKHMLLCPVCNRGVSLAGAKLKQVKLLNQIAVLYTTNAISGDEYMRRLHAIDGSLPGAASAAAGSPAAPAGASPDGFGGVQYAPWSSPTAPPMPSTPPPVRHMRISRKAQIVRVVVPIVAIAAAVTVWVLSNQSSNALQVATSTSAFQAGDCIDGTPTSAVITSVDCSGSHDGRIDQVLTGTDTFCPPSDDELMSVPPDPNLCVDFNDHSA